MLTQEIVKDIFWVGSIDWNIRRFHGPTFSTHRGTTYNSYLIKDQNTTLIDTVYTPFSKEFIKKIKGLIDINEVKYVVINHIEVDHSGAFPELMAHIPHAQVFASKKAIEGLKKMYPGDYNYNVVKTGDKLSLGKRTLYFIEAPMLHWPDSMFTYIEEDHILMPNDAFGQHLATAFRFDDEVDIGIIKEEAAKYYANILMPFSKLVIKKIEQLLQLNIPIKMIAPSHGIIWRSHPDKIIEAYLKWAGGNAVKKVVIAFDTMWDSTTKMADAIGEGIISQGVDVKQFLISKSDINDILTEIQGSKGILVGSSTINNDIIPSVAPLLEEMKGLKPVNKVGSAFGSYGWAGGSTETIEKFLQDAGVEIIEPKLDVQWVPSDEDLKMCYEYGKRIGEKINQGF